MDFSFEIKRILYIHGTVNFFRKFPDETSKRNNKTQSLLTAFEIDLNMFKEVIL